MRTHGVDKGIDTNYWTYTNHLMFSSINSLPIFLWLLCCFYFCCINMFVYYTTLHKTFLMIYCAFINAIPFVRFPTAKWFRIAHSRQKHKKISCFWLSLVYTLCQVLIRSMLDCCYYHYNYIGRYKYINIIL